WMREAILSGVGDRMFPFLKAIEEQNDKSGEGYNLIMKDLGEMFGNGASIAQCRELVRIVLAQENATSQAIGTVLGLAEGMSGRPESVEYSAMLPLLLATSHSADRETFMEGVYSSAEDTTVTTTQRVNALNLLGYTQDPRGLPLLQASLSPERLPEIQKAAINALSTQGSPAGGEILVSREVWSGFTPQVRSTVITSLVSNPVFVPLLLRAINDKVVSASDIPSITRTRLLAHKNEE